MRSSSMARTPERRSRPSPRQRRIRTPGSGILVIEALVKTGEGKAAIPILREGLAHPQPTIRIDVAYGLARIDPANEAAFRVLIEGLQYVDTAFRDALGGLTSELRKHCRGSSDACRAACDQP